MYHGIVHIHNINHSMYINIILQLLLLSSVYIILMTDNLPRLIVDGVHWTRFWWYTPDSGWPTTETDVLGG